MSNRELQFEWVDVFTDRPYAGNALAVFTDPGDLTTAQMQAIARELNVSETTFVGETLLAEADFKVRIFTPTTEIPLAGHPTLGTAHVLATQGRIAASRVVFELGVGPIEVEIDWEDGSPGRVVMAQPAPHFGRILDDRVLMAAVLGLGESDLADLPMQVLTTGPHFLFVGLSSLAAAEAASLNGGLWKEHLAETDAAAVYVFSLETAQPDAHVHGRLFAPSFGIPEDPATGSAVGPLGAYLVEQGVMGRDGAAEIVVEQGLEMGRPSRLEVEIASPPGEAMSVRVGGRTAPVVSGRISPPILDA